MKNYKNYFATMTLILFITTTIIAQNSDTKKHQKEVEKSLSKKSFVISMDTLFFSGKPLFLYKTVDNTLNKKLLNFKGELLVYILTQSSYSGTTYYQLSFPKNKQVVYMNVKGDDLKLFETLNENKVFVNTDIAVSAVNSMNGKNGVTVINNIEFTDPVEQDKELRKAFKAKASTEPVYKSSKSNTYSNYNTSGNKSNNTTTAESNTSSSSVSFNLKNNSSTTVKIFIGTKPKYGSGRTTSIGGNTRTSENGYVGNQLCIVDDSDNPISCMTISNSMGTIYINSKGNGFGDN